MTFAFFLLHLLHSTSTSLIFSRLHREGGVDFEFHVFSPPSQANHRPDLPFFRIHRFTPHAVKDVKETLRFREGGYFAKTHWKSADYNSCEGVKEDL